MSKWANDFPIGDFELEDNPMQDWEIVYRNSLGKGIYNKMIALTWDAEVDENLPKVNPLAVRSLSLVGRYLHDCSPLLPYNFDNFESYATKQDGLDIFDFLQGSVIDAAYYYIGECNVANKVIEFYDEV